MKLVFICFIFPGMCFGQKAQKTDVQIEGLKGQVKTFQSFHYRIGKEELQKPADSMKTLLATITFNNQGKKTSGSYYTLNGNPSYTTSYKYNDKGQLIEFSNNGREENEKCVYSYDKKGNCTVETIYDLNGKVTHTFTTAYDSTNNKTRVSSYNRAGKLLWTEQYTYDTSNHMIAFTKDDHDGLSQKTVCTYDAFGNKLEETQSSRGIVQVKNGWKYDSLGRMTEKLIYDEAGEKVDHRFTFKYDEKGNRVEETHYFSDGDLAGTTAFRFDGLGNEVESIQYFTQGVFGVREINIYDSQGNRIERALYDAEGSLLEKSCYKFDDYHNKTEEVTYVYKPDNGVMIEWVKSYLSWAYTYFE